MRRSKASNNGVTVEMNGCEQVKWCEDEDEKLGVKILMVVPWLGGCY